MVPTRIGCSLVGIRFKERPGVPGTFPLGPSSLRRGRTRLYAVRTLTDGFCLVTRSRMIPVVDTIVNGGQGSAAAARHLLRYLGSSVERSRRTWPRETFVSHRYASEAVTCSLPPLHTSNRYGRSERMLKHCEHPPWLRATRSDLKMAVSQQKQYENYLMGQNLC